MGHYAFTVKCVAGYSHFGIGMLAGLHRIFCLRKSAICLMKLSGYVSGIEDLGEN